MRNKTVRYIDNLRWSLTPQKSGKLLNCAPLPVQSSGQVLCFYLWGKVTNSTLNILNMLENLQKMFYKTLAALNFSFHSAFNLINGPSPALLGLQQWSCNSKMSQINQLVSSTGIQTHDFSNMSLLP